LEQGHNVQLVRRDNRQGFKAGAMVDGMARVADQGFEYVAIFDADFEPPEDFLYQTVIHMMRDDNLAFVQTRWTFTNCNSLLTWAQKVGLAFHFAVEQRARSFLGQFFNFNGTAGVWRIKAINDAGGWESDTVVEDMDLSLRVYLRGWRSLYLHDVCCPNELPSTLSAYKTQQFRWLSGPMQIVRKSFANIFFNKEIGFFGKLNCYWFFCRYFLFALVTLVALLASPIILWLDPWVWGFPTIFFLVSANVAVVVYLYFTIFSYVFLLFRCGLLLLLLWVVGVCGGSCAVECRFRPFAQFKHNAQPKHNPNTITTQRRPWLLQAVGHDQRHPRPQKVQVVEGHAQVRRQRQQRLAALVPQALPLRAAAVWLLRGHARRQHLDRELGPDRVQRRHGAVVPGRRVWRLLPVKRRRRRAVRRCQQAVKASTRCTARLGHRVHTFWWRRITYLF
jgi:hypothetical protein